MEDMEFVDGLIVKAPHPKAPDFVKASISIKVAELQAWLATRDSEWVNCDVKESKGGRWYCAVSQFKPKQAEAPKAKPAGRFDDLEDDLPF